MADKYTGGDVGEQVASILDEYAKEVREEATKVIKDVAEETAKKVAEASPVSDARGRHYAKGWKVKSVHTAGVADDDVVVYNATKPQLTHLLENGWVMRNGERHQGVPHISKGEEWAESVIVQRIEAKL